jgi:predicted phage tail protein
LKKYNVYGKGGGGGGSSEPYIPVEEENTLTSTTTARIVDLLGEGEIYQPAVDNNWYKSTYFNEVPVMNDNGELNFEGVTISAKHGTETQDYLKGFDAVETFFTVNTELTYNTPIIRTLSDTDVDDIKITISVPRLFIQEDDGDIRKNKVTYQVTITPDNGAGSEVSVISPNDSGVIEGKCITEYRKQHIIENISQYGNAPWVIKVYKSTEDSESLKDLRNISWYSYTTVKNVKIAYRNRAVVGVTLDAKKFNNQIPYRAYHVKGRLIKYPSNYNPTSRKYTGTWDGTWVTGYTNNPAWILNDILSSKRFGAGLAENQISKWSLYSIAQYCDETVSYKEAIRGADGKYVETTKYEPRFTFNGVIGSRAEALAVVNHLCSVFRGFPIYTTGMIGFIQDSPRDVSRVANPSNVINGLFEYEGVPMQLRHTAAKVSWNNPEIFGRLDVLVVEDEDGIAKYGYNPIDITCFGCISKSEAIRRAKYILYTDINQTESVTFQAGLDFADCIPGEIVSVQDPNYADVVLSGRVVSGTTTSITIDREIELEDDVEYTLRVQTRWYDETSATYKDIKEVTLTNDSGTTNTLTWSGAFDEAPETDAVWVLSSSSVATREFIVMRVSETDNTQFTVQGIEYDPVKYQLVESNIKYDATPDTTLDSGVLNPPSNIQLQPYSYTESDQSVRKYGFGHWMDSFTRR